MTDFFGENVRYLLWSRGIKHATWSRQVAEWAGCDLARAEELLQGESPSAAELERLARVLEVPDEELRLGRLFDSTRVDVLGKNIEHLLDGLAHGEHKQLAAALDVHPTTVSRWSGGKQQPPAATRERLCRYFGKPAGTDLTTEPLFLDPTPHSEQGMRDRLENYIRQMSVRTLRELYPALERLLNKP